MRFWQNLYRGASSVVKAPFGYKNPMEQPPERSMANILLAGGSMGFPGAWTADRTEQVRHYKGWTYIAIKAIAEEVAVNPPTVAAVRSRAEALKKGLHVLSREERRKSLTSVQEHEDLEPIDSGHPLCKLLANPNGPDVGYSFWYETMMFLELTGNAYWWVVNNRLGVPCELWVLPSHWVWPISGNGKMIEFYEIRPWGAPGSARAIKLDADEVVPFTYKNPLSKIDGLSPLAAAAEWIDTAESIDQSRWHSFRNGIWPGLVLELDPSVEDPSQSDIDRLYQRLESRGKGVTKVDRPIVLTPGVKANQITRSPREMDFGQGGDQMRDWVMAAHKVGKSIAGITEEVNYASMIAATANFVTRTIKPKLSYIGQVATEKLASRFDSRLVVYWNDITPDDPSQKTADLQADWSMNAVTVNEVRKARGRPPLKDGDVTARDVASQAAGQPPSQPFDLPKNPFAPPAPPPGAEQQQQNPQSDAEADFGP